MCHNKIEKKYVEQFLICATIPEVKSQKSMPKGMTNSNLLWDSIWRAHRDVLTAQKNVAYYYDDALKIKSNGIHREVVSQNPKKYKEVDNMINKIPVDLYYKLNCSEKTIFKPREIIKDLYNSYEKKVKVGALQKLVNMTFKYLYILKYYGKEDESIKHIQFNIEDCDCPLDHIILSKVPDYNNQQWTDIEDMEAYTIIQNKIKENNKNGFGLIFDFTNYYELS